MALTILTPAVVHPWLALVCLVGLIGLLGFAAISDLRRRRITNEACLCIALLALPYWLAMEPFHPARFGVQAAVALAIGMVLVALFALDLIGGGDVKMLSALALWLRPQDVLHCLAVIAIAGGVLGLVVALASRRRIAQPTVPYGLAIAVGAVATIGPRLLQLVG